MIYSLSERAKLTNSEKEEFERQVETEKRNRAESDTNSVDLGRETVWVIWQIQCMKKKS